jgi:hypothetical protein
MTEREAQLEAGIRSAEKRVDVGCARDVKSSEMVDRAQAVGYEI